MAKEFPAWDTNEDKTLVLNIVLETGKQELTPILEFMAGKPVAFSKVLNHLAALRFLLGFARSLEYAKPEEVNRAVFDKIVKLGKIVDEGYKGMSLETLLHQKLVAASKKK